MASAATAGATATSKEPRRWNRWFGVAILVLAVIGIGFGLTVLVNSQAVIGNAHERNAHSLEIIAADLEAWPRILADVAKNRYAEANLVPESGGEALVRHPELGSFKISYSANCPSETTEPEGQDRQQPFFPPGARPGDGDQLKLAGRFDDSGQEVCFTTSVPLDRLIAIERSAPEFNNLLITTPDGTVIEQLGESRLPVVRLPDFTPVGNFAKDLSGVILVTEKSAQTTSKTTLDASPGAVRIRIADVDNFAYVRPVRLDRSGQKCPVAAPPPPIALASGLGAAALAGQPARPGQPSGTTSTSTPSWSAGDSCQLFLVGLMPSSTLRRAWLAPPPLVLASFGLGLSLMLTLLPLARLLLIGGTESVGAAEVGAIVFGTNAAAAIATLALLFAFEAGGERRLAREEAERLAARLANDAGHEIQTVLANAALCIEKPAQPQWSWQYNILEASFLNALGTADPASRPICRQPLPSTTDVGGRPYFQKLQQRIDLLPWAIGPYTMAQVRAQTDGISKTVILGGDALNPLLVSSISRTFLAPILPAPQRFMVVDAADYRLPVIFHSRPGRAFHEDLAGELRHSSVLADALRRLASSGSAKTSVKPSDTLSFQRRYDGAVANFSAAPIPHSNWVVLVYHPVDEVDVIAAGTALRALLSWGSVAILAMAACGWYLFRLRAEWRCLWPFRNAEPIYRGSIKYILAGAAVTLALAMLVPWIAPDFWPTPLPAVLIAAGISLWLYKKLRSQPLTPEPLCLETERSYRAFVLSMLICVACAPMVAFWSDARLLSRDLVDAARISSAAGALSERRSEVSALQGALDRDPKVDVFAPWGIKVDAGVVAQGGSRSFAELAAKMRSGIPVPDLLLCRFPGNAEQNAPWYCWRKGGKRTLADRVAVKERDLAVPVSPLAIVLLVVLGVALAVLIYAAVYYGLWALTGFGIPLNAVVWPKLVLDSAPNRANNERPLARRSLLVAPQRALRERIAHEPRARTVDVADTLLRLPDTQFAQNVNTDGLITIPEYIKGKRAEILVVTGVELLLRDLPRRRAALGFLERADAALEEPLTKRMKKLVVIAEMSPLERILDAFDNFEKDDPTRETMREELRWAALFQDFTTFSFAPVDKIDQVQLDAEFPDYGALERARCERVRQAFDRRQADRARRQSKLVLYAEQVVDRFKEAGHLRKLAEINLRRRVLVEELRWLPGNVIDGVLAEGGPTLADGAVLRFPVGDAFYRDHYTPRVIAWAKAVDPVTREAAIDFLRANLIEYFEQCWASSTFAERVILDAMARGAYVNMRKALALQSLVRRGLVVFDPAPRLMSESFAAFIRQSERPDTLATWRENQPNSAWSMARIPILVVLPLLVLGLAVAAAESGQELGAVLPLLAAGAPTLIATIVKQIRGG